jgi:hypothetical protein
VDPLLDLVVVAFDVGPKPSRSSTETTLEAVTSGVTSRSWRFGLERR